MAFVESALLQIVRSHPMSAAERLFFWEAHVKKHGRGGPRKKSGARYPNGRLRQVKEGPTPEHERHRNELVGTTDPKKQSLAACEMGIRYAHHDINGSEFSAGQRYARLFMNAVNPVAIPSVLGNLVAGARIASTGADDQLAGFERHPETGAVVPLGTVAREEFLEARKVLGRCGDRVANAVDEIAVYDQPCDPVKRPLVKKGLDALAQHFDLVDERRRR